MVREIPLRSTKYPGLVALVDDEDYERVAQHRWCPYRGRGNTFYAVSRVNGSNRPAVQMQRYLIGGDLIVDHIDGNGLNNVRSNFRPCRQQQNIMNRVAKRGGTSKYKGVYWYKRIGKWSARIAMDGK